ncbi:MAG: hypothetical protein DMG89_04890 [Acidobacteria bacterium]|nr:MAG: hypothetical protein DMG89_04890 [Acidobacteriota bacterium]
MSTRTITPTIAVPIPAITPVRGPVLQRTCDCGQHTIGGAECEECKKKKTSLQRHADGQGEPSGVPPIVHDVLGTPGQPLEDDTRAFFEPRFGHDFTRVRVHNDAQAAASARAVNALAYAVGNNIVFGAGQYAPSNGRGKRLLAHELTHVMQQQNQSSSAVQYQLEIGPSKDRFEQEADQLADQVMKGRELNSITTGEPSAAHPSHRLQRATDGSEAATAETKVAPAPTGVPLLVEDDEEKLQPGQMRKGEFLDKLQISVCAAADEELKAVGRTTQACPYLERWMNHFRAKDSAHVERALRKYAPESAGVTRAESYIPAVTARVRRGVARWAKTGEITEVPSELRGQLLAANVVGAIENAVSGIGKAIGKGISAVGRGVKKAASAIGGLFAKEHVGGLRGTSDPGKIQAQLGSGHPLDGGVKSRMETVFGGNFSQVRVHTDSTAAELSTQLNARAFTVGRDVAFGAGEYRPGTVIGDALIAHELAHVVQQGYSSSAVAPISQGSAEHSALEEDADLSAAGAALSLWSGVEKGLAELNGSAMPMLKSGLRLQSCSKTSEPEKKTGGDKKEVVPSGAETKGADAGAANCCCCVKDVTIKNISKIRSGDLYGHKYDLVIEMEYKGTEKKTAADCTLKWLEKTNRSYYPTMRDNEWNDMFVLVPESPTFNPWTKSRRMPCPGSETVTITDPPQADLKKPPRTLEFKMTVGSGSDCGCTNASKTVNAKQVLEPDGKGGIKTQDFTSV